MTHLNVAYYIRIIRASVALALPPPEDHTFMARGDRKNLAGGLSPVRRGRGVSHSWVGAGEPEGLGRALMRHFPTRDAGGGSSAAAARTLKFVMEETP